MNGQLPLRSSASVCPSPQKVLWCPDSHQQPQALADLLPVLQVFRNSPRRGVISFLSRFPLLIQRGFEARVFLSRTLSCRPGSAGPSPCRHSPSAPAFARTLSSGHAPTPTPCCHLPPPHVAGRL